MMRQTTVHLITEIRNMYGSTTKYVRIKTDVLYQYMRYSTIVYPLKTEYGHEIKVFGKSEKWPRNFFFEIPPYAKPFSDSLIYFIK
jgi:hypothetical protein